MLDAIRNGIVADRVMHRSLKPDDVGSMPTGPTDKHWSFSGKDTAPGTARRVVMR